MRFLAVCDHSKQIIVGHSVSQARVQFRCKRCVAFDDRAREWKYKDVRIYPASDSDDRVVTASGSDDGHVSSHRKRRGHQKHGIRLNRSAFTQEELFPPDVPSLPKDTPESDR